MRFRVLACDYDGTLAVRGAVAPRTLDALREVADSGRHLLLVTGRTREELLDVFNELELFDAIVIENGAVLLDPVTGAMQPLAPPVPHALVALLHRKGVERVVTGRVICATWSEHAGTVRAAIRELGLDVTAELNRDSVMVLPRGVSKATGLASALRNLGETFSTTVAVGDGENDLPMIETAEIGVAVSDAVPLLKQRADVTLEAANGAGIPMLCSAIVRDDLSELLPVAVHRRAG
jgi:hydroxymethylpyrimidine pyrophosphatase-like HAD family hydrolase